MMLGQNPLLKFGIDGERHDIFLNGFQNQIFEPEVKYSSCFIFLQLVENSVLYLLILFHRAFSFHFFKSCIL